jgi:MSHA biogenesis protein MshP
MCRDRRVPEGGFVLLAAIILLVLLSAIGVFMVTLSTTQHATASQDSQGSRAYQAARSGVEWGMYQVLQNRQCADQSDLVLPAATLANFTVHMSCLSQSYEEGDQHLTVYQITATAQSGIAGSSGYVERQLSSTLSTCLLDGAACAD